MPVDPFGPAREPTPERDARWWERQVARYTYKPGWRLQVMPAPPDPFTGGGVSLGLTALVPDVRDPDRIAQIGYRQLVSTYFTGDESYADHFVQGLIRTMELHEMDEWLKKDGVWVRDPHPEIRRQG